MNNPKTIYETVRYHPGMFIGGVYSSAVSNLIKQLLIDTLKDFKCKKIEVFILRNKSIRIQFTPTNAGDDTKMSSFFAKKVIPKYPLLIGKVSAIALSEYFSVTAGGEIYECSNTHRVIKKHNTDTLQSGNVSIEFKLSKNYLKEIIPDKKLLPEYLFTLSACNPDLRIIYTDKTQSPFTRNSYHFPNGLKDLMSYLIRTQENTHTIHQFQFKSELISADIAFCINNYYRTFRWSAMNNEYTQDNGTHVDGVIEGCLTYIKNIAKSTKKKLPSWHNKYFPEHIAVAISAHSDNADYYGSVKDQITTKDFVPVISKAVQEYLETLAKENPQEQQKFIKRFIG
jgi:DNA gyrase/topoisomerase IV subunit B